MPQLPARKRKTENVRQETVLHSHKQNCDWKAVSITGVRRLTEPHTSRQKFQIRFMFMADRIATEGRHEHSGPD